MNAAPWWLRPRPVGQPRLTLADVDMDVTEPHLRVARHRRYDHADMPGDGRGYRGVHRPGIGRYAGRHQPAAGYGRALQVDRAAESTQPNWLTVTELQRLFAERELTTGGVQ